MIRVFPRRTKATPDDDLVFYDGPLLWPIKDEDVYVSCTFTWDKPKAERLAELWAAKEYEVKLGGPAYDDPGGDFVPGRFLKPGYIITSRGCNNHCWFCYTPKREGAIRELPITDGFNVQDSNLLQCSEKHICSVFAMLKKQTQPIEFAGGLAASEFAGWHIDLLLGLKLKRIYFAYDTPDDYESLVIASQLLKRSGLLSRQKISVYVLIGYPKDTFNDAESRLKQVVKLGITPYAMLYRSDEGKYNYEWKQFQRKWIRPHIIFSNVKV